MSDLTQRIRREIRGVWFLGISALIFGPLMAWFSYTILLAIWNRNYGGFTSLMGLFFWSGGVLVGIIAFIYGVFHLVYETRPSLDDEIIAPLGTDAERGTFVAAFQRGLNDFLADKPLTRKEKRIFVWFAFEVVSRSNLKGFLGMTASRIRPLLRPGKEQQLHELIMHGLPPLWSYFVEHGG